MNTRKNLIGSLAEGIKAIPEERWAYLEYQNDISDKIAAFMEEHSISKVELARRLKTSRAYITKVLRGNANMTMKTFVSLLFALEAKPDTKIISNNANIKENVSAIFSIISKNKDENIVPVSWQLDEKIETTAKEGMYESIAA